MIGSETPNLRPARSKLRNVLRGLRPVAATFDAASDIMSATPATNLLTNATDGNPSTSTGVGSKVLGAAGLIGTLVFDLGSTKNVLVGGKFGIWSTAGTVTVFISSSDDNITWKGVFNTILSATSSSESIRDSENAGVMIGRYIRYQFQTTTAATGYVKAYECMVYELG